MPLPQAGQETELSGSDSISILNEERCKSLDQQRSGEWAQQDLNFATNPREKRTFRVQAAQNAAHLESIVHPGPLSQIQI